MSRIAGTPKSSSKLEHLRRSLEVLNLLHKEGKPVLEDHISSLLQGCSGMKSLAVSRQLHSFMVSNDLESVSCLGDPFIRVFTSCSSLLEANLVFCKVADPSVYTWQAILSAHLKHGENARALDFYHQMLNEGARPNKFIFTGGLKACAALGAIQQGKDIHDQIIKSGSKSDLFVESILIDMYMKCGNLDEAQRVFDLLLVRDEVSWSTMIAGYSQHGHGLIALELFHDMRKQGKEPSDYTFSCVLKACGSVGAIDEGKQIQDQIIKIGLDSDTVIGNALISMHNNYGNLYDARKVFDRLLKRTIVSWGTMIAGYAQYGYGLPALQLLMNMQHEAIKPNRAIFLYSLKACSSIVAIVEGKLIHDQVLRSGVESDVAIGNSLVDVYGKCGYLMEGHKVHDSLPDQSMVSWGAIIQGYTQHGHGFSALKLFKKMQHEGLLPDKVVYLCILKACGSIGDVGHIKLIHIQLLDNDLVSDEVITNALLDMYAKCGHMGEACKLFEQTSSHNMVSWSSMIRGYAHAGHNLLAVGLYNNMQQEGKKPDRVIYLSILKACANLGVFGQGKRIHDHIIRSGLEVDMEIGNSLVDMYAKCGVLEEACKVFDTLPNKDVVSWGAMISGYAHCGLSGHVKQRLVEMQEQGLKPNSAIYASVLSACSHVGAVVEGLQFFNSMQGDHGNTPSIEHITCMADLLGRAGSLGEAKWLLLATDNFSDIIGWTSLLSACRTYGNMKLWSDCNHQIFKLNSNFAPSLCSNTIRSGRPVKEDGFVPELSLVFESVIDKQKEELSCRDSGELTTPASTSAHILTSPQLYNTGCHDNNEFVSNIKKGEVKFCAVQSCLLL